MNKYIQLSSLFLICCFAPLAAAVEQVTAEHWDRNSAMAAVGAADIDHAVYQIGDISSLADGQATLGRLIALESRPDWPLPAREAAIYQFTRYLADLPPDAVAKEVLQHLQNYRAKALVPHEEHPGAFIPLFNIRGAAIGVENTWQRMEYSTEARILMDTDPVALVPVFAKAVSHNQQSGYLDALRYADMAELIIIQDAAIQSLQDTPALTPMVAVTATLTADVFAIQQLLINGKGAGLSAALAQSDDLLPSSETAELLAFAIQQAPPSNAALAMAAWWPRLKHDPASRDLLIDTLADPELGSSAALALSNEPDIQTIKELQVAASGDSISARRAQMALDFSGARLMGDVQP